MSVSGLTASLMLLLLCVCANAGDEGKRGLLRGLLEGKLGEVEVGERDFAGTVLLLLSPEETTVGLDADFFEEVDACRFTPNFLTDSAPALEVEGCLSRPDLDEAIRVGGKDEW